MARLNLLGGSTCSAGDAEAVIEPRDPSRLRVMVLNLWAHGGSWPQRRAVLEAGIRHLNPDIVAFVEAVKTPIEDQAGELLADGYHLAHQGDRATANHGAVIASRWPIQDLEELDLHVTPRTADFECTALIAEIDVPDPFGRVIFANHVPNWQLDFERERELQAVATAQALETRVRDRSLHVIVAGDLTADPDSASVRFWTGRQSLDGVSVCYRDAWASAHPDDPGHTFIPDNPLVADWDWPFRRLDYVLVRCGRHGGPTLAIESCELVFHKPIGGVWASDHFGVVADLVTPQR